jgi:spore maturation protein CgeB
VQILVGDSCLLGSHYTSDRIPETLGRGGFLLHPETEGLRDLYPEGTLVTWPLGDWQELRWLIDYYLDRPDERHAIAEAGRGWVMAFHTYEVRMRTMFDVLTGRGLLPASGD